jgi:hypothetical protein
MNVARRWSGGFLVVICGSNHLCRKFSENSNHVSSKEINSCEEYNSIYWKMNQKTREMKCEQVTGNGCAFEGRGWTGKCQPLQRPGTRPQSSKSTSNHIYSLLVKKDSEDVVVAIEGLMKETFTSSVADSIEKSHEVAHEVAKAIVLDVFQNTDNIQHLGTLLGRIFADETVLSSTRALTYYYLHIDPTMTSLMWQLNWLRFYYCRGGGKVP